MQHYRCFRVWAVGTNVERIADTVSWFPRIFSMSQSSPHDTVVTSTYDLTHTLLKPRPVSPVLIVFESIYSSVLELSDIFRNSILSGPREYPLKDIVDDVEPSSLSIEGGTLAVLNDPISPVNIASSTDPVLHRMETVPTIDTY